MTSWKTSPIGSPKNSGRYLSVLTTSGARWRDSSADHGEQGLGRQRVTVVEDVEPHRFTSIASGCGVRTPAGVAVERRQRGLELPRRLTERGAHGQLEDLVLGHAGGLRRGDVVVGDLPRVPRHLVDQRARPLVHALVVERGPPRRTARLPGPFSTRSTTRYRLAVLFIRYRLSSLYEHRLSKDRDGERFGCAFSHSSRVTVFFS